MGTERGTEMISEGRQTLSLRTYNEMRGREEHSQRGYNCEERENNKAQTIHDHCGKLPVARYVAGLVLFLELPD